MDDYDGPHGRNQAPLLAPEHEVDPRLLFATKFWGRRRYSDSVSQLPQHGLTQALRQLNREHSNGPAYHLVPDDAQLPPTPTSARSLHPNVPSHNQPSPSPSPYVHPPHLPAPTPSPKPQPSFLLIQGYTPHPIHPRNPFPLPTRRDELADALAKIDAKAGPVSLKGVGGLARPLLADGSGSQGNRAHGARGLGYWMDFAGRSLLIPVCIPGPIPGSEVNQRDLRRLESEVFDTAKYVGGSDTNHLTVLTWSEDSSYGTVTLFEVDVEHPTPSRSDIHTTGLAARRRHAPTALYTGGTRERALGVRPVAAVEDVPRQVLVNMRIDQGVKKAVLQHDRGAGRFRWKAHHTRRGQPGFTRVWGMDDFREVHTATAAGFGDDYYGRSTRRPRRRDGSRRERSSLRVEDARDIIANRGAVRMEAGPIMQDVDGVVATIPQFLALLHASRSIIEKASSAPATARLVETEGGERLRAVSLSDAPRGTRHRGRDVHVVVLVPDGAKWATERIFWADDNGGLAEFKQKKYQNVIDGARARTRGTRAYDRDWDARGLSPLSPPPASRSAMW
ncbi:hypothetical protein C8A01DRAFT_15472 [Parachaetomium inaequale]|uniref:Uncharacterized protein n=1 Tax=Parachaetomium inaequale TaxID=2588326 RepID=A0AAN6PK84_9PEZI|nr:hypothetical protein C8A01DRAFT_15472 [Parachaetomium inaequale]